ncbi:MAG: DEAD/DEAH box helicase [Xenococcaceae cyanobacterium MO_207.B15]|nr:DEAD/DEAH box helicase [Xenococcaceae cyanobacterium MO_207.B15]
MKPTFKLKDLIQQGESAITATSTLIAQGMVAIDCSEVESLTEEQLTQLFSGIPDNWDFIELAEVFDIDTFDDTLAQQFSEYCDRRHGRLDLTPQVSADQKKANQALDIFKLRDEVIGDYRNYIESFLEIRDPNIDRFVQEALNKGLLWKDPLIQINPAYKKGADIDALIKEGILHSECKKYFPSFHFYYHQEQAFRCAKKNEPYVVTTGTGSGKSLSYVVPIINDLLQNPQLKGIRAILVYPMNALINSQEEEFRKFIGQVANSNIRVARYTGQETLSQKSDIQNNPPHILLTNYVMLELMLSRVHEQKLVQSPILKYLVLDELHTYRGRQGADVAMVIRKLRQISHKAKKGKNIPILCIGTSATMSTEGDRTNRQTTVADVASKLFGVEVKPTNVIDETLEPAIIRTPPTKEELTKCLQTGLPAEEQQTPEAFVKHPLSKWIEMNFGLDEEDGHLIRRTPIALSQGSKQLSQFTGIDAEICSNTLKQMFFWSSRINKGLPFRLHQFISQGGSVYATLESREKRYLTLEGQYKTTGDRLLFPLVFCRECGQDYYAIRYKTDKDEITPLLPIAIDNDSDEDIEEGYLTLDEPDLWSDADQDLLPDNWFKETKTYGRKVKKEYEKFIPHKLYIYPNGTIKQGAVTDSKAGKCNSFWFIPKPFLTCLNCGIVYDRKPKEYTKLARLSSEGRSTSTTLLCLSSVTRLKETQTISPEAAKILSFTDNRQDASLQAGHFNDFVQTSFLRASLNGALQAKQKLTHSDLAAVVVQQMGLSQSEYAEQPAEHGVGKKRNQQVFERLLEYRLYEDLRRGWRIVQPNLEQCGLLEIKYDELEAVCSDRTVWTKYPYSVLLQASPEQRYTVIKTFLDYLRKQLAIDAELLQSENLDKLRRDATQALNYKWKFDREERLHEAKWATFIVGDSKDKSKIKLTASSKIGRFLKGDRAWSWLTSSLSEPEYQELITSLINTLRDYGYLKQNGKNEIQLRIDSIVWKSSKSDRLAVDILNSKRLQGKEEQGRKVNQFFQTFYSSNAQTIKTMEGREHTGQVNYENRKKREEKFRNGKLSTLFCSPTMELGIDISDLSVVHLRNVPPSPANYAQRSGRAGRGGQNALVVTYAAAGSPHDQYFYQRQQQMVAGVVVPPRLELANQDLVKSHVYSLWLSYTGVYLGNSMNEILDLEQDYPYPLKNDIKAQLKLNKEALQECFDDLDKILSDSYCQTDLQKVSWYSQEWLKDILDNAFYAFERTCDRWRSLYYDADNQLASARENIDRHSRGSSSKEERREAEALEKEAKRQKDLLVGQSQRNNKSQFDFYPYRYFASEGFLPGFNFPRLPVRAYIRAGDKGEFISRPRTIAIRELAPTNVLYYEGNKFQINKTRIPVKGVVYNQIAICHHCGYFHNGEDYHRNTCANCGEKLSQDDKGNPAKLTQVLEMDNAIARKTNRITCDEEERLKYGYDLITHFQYAPQKQRKAKVIAEDGTELLYLSYGETADILRINRGLTKSKEIGFKFDTASGDWVSKDNNYQPQGEVHTNVHLMVKDTSNILIIQPLAFPEQETKSFIVTLQYALERAIQAQYKLENNELSSELLGNKNHILFWESSEGGAGVLSQILEDGASMEKIAQEALDICHFVEPKDSCAQACYQCLLSYSNQFDHPHLNRHLIRDFLVQLQSSVITIELNTTFREAKYQKLWEQTDPNSPFEREVLKEIYQKGIKLPDSAQELIPEANCKPDFLYKRYRIAIFCDGSVHDSPEQQQRDRLQRQDLQWNGYQLVELNYKQNWQSTLESLRSWVQNT